MFLNKFWAMILFFSTTAFFGQEKVVKKDSIKNNLLDEVVVTGQYNAQSIKKSVHNVLVIKSEDIEKQAANNLADLLNFNLNLTIIPNSQSGKSTISFLGLDAQYFNILIDNIPLISDTGLGNNIDLTQVNLDDVKQIEIVEGAMGVEYGANAVSGVINIITKKGIQNKWRVSAAVQEETARNEYALFNEGKHIQNFSLAHNFSDNWFGRVGVNRNQFAGFYNNKKGRDYYINNGLRGYSWLPKTQVSTNAFVTYNKDNFKLHYKVEYFNEVVKFYDETVRRNYNSTTQSINPSSTDKIFKTNRILNNLNLSGFMNSGINYNVSLSYQNQKRYLNEFNYYILNGKKSNETDKVYQSSNVFFSRGTVNNFVKNDFYDLQLGYEAKYISGFDTQASGSITQKEKEKKQITSALFASSELKFSKNFMLRPGVRYEYNSLFKSKLVSSLNTRYLMKKGFELRANVGSSYRTPNFEELYYYFVDSNHDVRGNESLNPENGFSTSVSLKKNSWFKNTSLLNSLKLSYLDVSDKIDLAIVNESPLKYQFININQYRLWGITTENTLKNNNWTFNFGATLQGNSRAASNEVGVNNKFLHSFQLNTSGTYKISDWNTAISVLFKHNGAQQNYRASGVDKNGNSLYVKSKTASYNWLDASVKKAFLNNKLQATLGARNLLDVTNVAVSGDNSSGVHASNNGSLLLGYGRSYYLKLLFILNFKN